MEAFSYGFFAWTYDCKQVGGKLSEHHVGRFWKFGLALVLELVALGWVGLLTFGIVVLQERGTELLLMACRDHHVNASLPVWHFYHFEI